ncbi:MAG TPA: HAMP domain-containing protein, partial [Gemmatimonadales bacterium]|nr:HAMP domain-containing protein [Gemmatimonadales bacterium]
MTFPSTPLRSRFGRRLLVLFVGCALVPMAVLASLSYRHVKQQLYRQSEHQLQQANLALSQAVFERLLLLDATLKSIPPKAILQLNAAKRIPRRAPKPRPLPVPKPGNRTQAGNTDGRVAMGGIVLDRTPRLVTTVRQAPSRAELIAASQTLIAGLDLLARQRFVAVEFVGDDAKRIEIFGRLTHRPRLTGRDSSDLRLGLPLIITKYPKGKPSRVYLMRRIVHRGEVRGTLVGEASPEYLWGNLEQSLPSQTTRLAVMDDSAHVIYTFTRLLGTVPDSTADSAGVAPDSLVVDPAGQSYLSASSEIRLAEAFAAQPWRVVLTEPKDAVLEPMVDFSKTFLTVIGLSGVMVLLLSISQIRRSVLPLEELQKGTRRIAQRDFTSRVTVTSRDEFEQLAASFNTMATQLGRQFNALATAAEIDRAVLSATDATTIV